MSGNEIDEISLVIRPRRFGMRHGDVMREGGCLVNDVMSDDPSVMMKQSEFNPMLGSTWRGGPPRTC